MRTMSGSPCPHYDCTNRNSFGYCKTTVCINEHYQQEQWGQSTTNKSGGVVIKQQTNADRIRAMNDEELASLLMYFADDTDEIEEKDYDAFGNMEWRKRMLRWLKQEATE